MSTKRRIPRTIVRTVNEYCAVGHGRDPKTGLMCGTICFYRKAQTERYIRNAKKRGSKCFHSLVTRRTRRVIRPKQAGVSGARRKKR